MNDFCLEHVIGKEIRPLSANFPAGLHVIKTHDKVAHGELFYLMTGLGSPRRGTVSLRQRLPARDPELRSHIGSLWPVERFDETVPIERSLRRLGLSTTRLEAMRRIAESLGEPALLDGTQAPFTPARHRLIALTVALTTVEPFVLLLHEPLVDLNRTAQSRVLERLLVHSTNIPVLLFTANAATAAQLGGSRFDLRLGYLRLMSSAQCEFSVVRVTGVGLRTLNGELSKRPSVRSLRFAVEPLGHEVLWIETGDPRRMSLDIVRIALELEIRLLSLQTVEVPS